MSAHDIGAPACTCTGKLRDLACPVHGHPRTMARDLALLAVAIGERCSDLDEQQLGGQLDAGELEAAAVHCEGACAVLYALLERIQDTRLRAMMAPCVCGLDRGDHMAAPPHAGDQETGSSCVGFQPAAVAERDDDTWRAPAPSDHGEAMHLGGGQ